MKIKFIFVATILLFNLFFISSNIENVEGDLRVVVQIKEPSPEKGFFFKSQKTDSEIKIEKKEIKQGIIDRIDPEKINHIFEESIAVKMNEKDLINLEKDPNIRAIIVDQVMNKFLQDSVPLINATAVWSKQISEINLTGEGETVCVIDGGINNTHPDFSGRILAEYCYCSLSEGAISNCCPGGTAQSVNATDNDGHGTHVSGIALASGGINGVAINSKLVSIKVLNSSGTGLSSDIRAGIDWCAGNSSIYNISVISMSLGGGAYNEYCDSSETGFRDSINAAVAKNISVIVATGNNGRTTQISSPACIQNATAVGWSNKDDTINAQGDRNNLTDLFAPGSNINSTYSNTLYKIQSGTSMSAPHVAGSFMLIRQFFRLQSNIILTPLQIQNVLNNTGKLIDDSSGSGLTFSRVDIYSAILSLDNDAPEVSLISPTNNSISRNFTQTFTCNATDELLISNISFYLWNSSGTIINQTTTNVSGTFNQTSFTIANLSSTNYLWNCLAQDSNNSAFANSNFSLTIANISVSLNSPENNKFVNTNQTNFTCSSQTSSGKLSNLTFFVWNSSSSLIYNQTTDVSGTSNSSTFQFNLTDEVAYIWNCESYNNVSQNTLGESNHTITYDITNPTITLVSPADSSTYTSNLQEINFGYNVTDNHNISNCSLIVEGIRNLTNSSITNFSLSQNFTQSFTPGSYTWNINCTDLANNFENSSQRSFSVSAPAVVQSSSSGGGGGGSSTKIYSSSPEESSNGYTKQLRKNDAIKFTFFDGTMKSHTLTLDVVGKDFVNITIRSEPIKIVLGIGQSIKINLTSEDYYDLYIKLEKIISGRAEITIQTIHEEIQKPKEMTGKAVEEPREVDETDVEEKIDLIGDEIKKLKILIIVLVAIFIISLTVILIRKKKK